MQLTSLDIPDSPDWQYTRHYRHSAAQALRRSFAMLWSKSQSLDTYWDVTQLLTPYLDETLAPEQEARVRYGLFKAFAAVGDHAQAIEYLDDISEICTATADIQSLAETHLWRSIARTCLAHLREALLECQVGVRLLHGLYVDNRALLPLLELKLLIDGTFASLFLERLDDAEEFLQQSSALLAQIKAERALKTRERRQSMDASSGELVLLEAKLAWANALYLRRNGLPGQAVEHVRVAADIYTSLGAPISAARAQTLAADITLDLAAQQGHPRDQEAVLGMAAWRLERAMARACEAVDTGTSALVTLASARLGRMRGEREDRLTPVARVADRAWQEWDIPSVVQSYTELGDEYTHRHEPGVAEGHYVLALDALRYSEAESLRARPLQGLHRVRREMGR